MRSIILKMIICMMLPGGVLFAADDQSTPKSTYDKYKVIYERNVFSKDRRPPHQERQDAGQTRTTTVLSIYVLRGIAAEAGRSHQFAFVEEQVSGQSQTVKVGAKILDGRITEIQMNYVMFEENGKTRKVRIGEEFGKTSSTVMVDVTESVGGDTPADDASPKEEKTEESLSAGEDDLLKKLMERRKSELGT